MSPRSEEFMDGARERLAAARDMFTTDHPSTALSAAYYAMLYAARAALSEEDRYAKTHKGVWSLFSELFVKTGRFEHALFKVASEDARELREQSDYEAATMTKEEAEEMTSAAERFIAAVDEMVGRET